MNLDVKVGGIWARSSGFVSNVKYATLADGGLGEASFDFALPPETYPRGFAKGALVEIFEEGIRRWYGRLEEYDPSERGVRCTPIWEDGDTLPALDETGASTRNLTAAIATARGYGWLVSPGTLSGTVPGDADDLTTMTDLLRSCADELGRRAGVTADGTLFVRPDSTTVKWIIDVDGLAIVAQAGATNALIGRYVNTSGTRATTHWPTVFPNPPRAETVDLTDRPRMIEASAKSTLAGILSRMGTEPTWTTGVTVHLSQIRNVGGVSPSTPTVIKAGDRVCLRSLTAAQQREVNAMSLEVVLGQVVVDEATPMQVYLEPVGVTPQTLEEAMEAVA